MPSVRHVILCVRLLVLAACTSRHRLTPPLPATFPVDQRVEVWRRGERVLLRRVAIDAAALTGTALGATAALLALWILKHCWPFYACVD